MGVVANVLLQLYYNMGFDIWSHIPPQVKISWYVTHFHFLKDD